jgi:hypothetical protein
MNVLTQGDVKEIKSRIESGSCPFCGQSCQVELSLSNDAIVPDTKTICCDKRKSVFLSELNNEISKQINLKISRIPG